MAASVGTDMVNHRAAGWLAASKRQPWSPRAPSCSPALVPDQRLTKVREQLVLAPHVTSLADVRTEAAIAVPVGAGTSGRGR
jgi:hypothetical protein